MCQNDSKQKFPFFFVCHLSLSTYKSCPTWIPLFHQIQTIECEYIRTCFSHLDIASRNQTFWGIWKYLRPHMFTWFIDRSYLSTSPFPGEHPLPHLSPPFPPPSMAIPVLAGIEASAYGESKFLLTSSHLQRLEAFLVKNYSKSQWHLRIHPSIFS